MIVGGVDLGVRKVAISLWVNGYLTHVADFEIPRYDRAKELRTLSHWTWSHLKVCDAAWVEETIIAGSRRTSVQMAQSCGAILNSLATLKYVGLVPVTMWKKEIIGSGNATKVEVATWLQTNYASYAALCAGNQDRIDATCIGLYGVRVHDRAGSLDEL